MVLAEGGEEVTLPLTPALLRATYDFLRQTPPFKNWVLPPGCEVRFRVTRSRTVQGDHLFEGGVHRVRVSQHKTGSTHTLVELMAHEMVHVVCDREGVRSEHGGRFRRLANTVCRYHGFDPKLF